MTEILILILIALVAISSVLNIKHTGNQSILLQRELQKIKDHLGIEDEEGDE